MVSTTVWALCRTVRSYPDIHGYTISGSDRSRYDLHRFGCLHSWSMVGICTMTQLPVTPEQRLETLREWLTKSEETGHYMGISRHQLFLMIQEHLKEYGDK